MINDDASPYIYRKLLLMMAFCNFIVNIVNTISRERYFIDTQNFGYKIELFCLVCIYKKPITNAEMCEMRFLYGLKIFQRQVVYNFIFLLFCKYKVNIWFSYICSNVQINFV